MKRKFVTNLILLVGLNLMVKPVYMLLVETEIQNRVGLEKFGSYFALINFSFILNILLDLGTTNWNTRKIAQSGSIPPDHLSGMLLLRLMLAFLYLVISVIIGFALKYDSWQMFILLILSFNQVLVSGILYLRSYLTGLHLFARDSIVSVLDRLILLILMSFLLWGRFSGDHSFQIEWLVYGQTISYGLTFLTAFALVYGKAGKTKIQLKTAFVSKILKESFPFAALILVSMIGYRIDGVMLERISGPGEAGIYAMGYRFFEAVNMIAYLFAVILLPMFARLLNSGENVSPLLHLSFKILFSGTLMITLFSCFFGHEVLSFVYQQNIEAATPVFAWLMCSALFFSLQYISGTLITASGNMRTMIYIALVCMFLNIALNWYLIPLYAAWGAAIASGVTQMIIFVSQTVVVLTRYKTENNRNLALKTLLYILISVGGGFIFMWIYQHSSRNPFVPALYLLTMIAAAIATKMLDFRKFLALIKTPH